MAAADKIRDSLAEHRLNKWYYERWQRDNKVEAPRVIAYLDGGARPADAEVGTHYGRGLVLAEDARRSLATEPPPPPPGLPFAEAALRSGYETLKGNTFGSSSQAVNGGEDCLIDLEGIVRSSTTTVWHKAGQRIHVKAGRWKDIKTGLVIRSMDGVGAEHVSATDMRGQNLIDGFVPAGNPNSPATKVTLQKIRTDVPSVNVNDGGEHADAVQTQGLLKRLEIGLSTFWLLGVSGGSGHPGKGLMLNTYAQAPFEVDLDHVNYRALLDGTGAAIFKAYTAISTRTNEVYYDGPYWGTSRAFYPTASFSGDTASWSGVNWQGVVKRGIPAGGDFCL